MTTQCVVRAAIDRGAQQSRNQKPRLCGVATRPNPPAPAKSLGRFRSDREKTRKAEISRDFSAFFAPNFFRISIDPFSIFLRVEGFELPKTHFFQNFITNESNTKNLNPRQGFKLFRFLCQSQNVYKQYITKQVHLFSKRIRTREKQ